MTRRAVLLAAAAAAATLALPGCASCSRGFKSLGSDLNGGMRRTVTLYSYDGDPIKTWEGRIDLAGDTDEIWFDLDGKRVNINGGIVVVEED